uniref:Uncharacterized protein n=1 Tax=Anguilla anguilla TaxID=7936 RepID=A0A0E9UB36_ANGAN
MVQIWLGYFWVKVFISGCFCNTFHTGFSQYIC